MLLKSPFDHFKVTVRLDGRQPRVMDVEVECSKD